MAEEERAATSRKFSAYGHTLDVVLSFKYLGRVILAEDDEWTALNRNLTKARSVWRRMTRILSREVMRPQVPVFFSKAIVQSVLIFSAETWVINPRMGQVLGGFQYQVARRLEGCLPQWRIDGKWEYTSAEEARAEVGFEPMETYIRKRQETAAQYIATRSILDLCEAADKNQEVQVGVRWWEQTVIDLVVER